MKIFSTAIFVRDFIIKGQKSLWINNYTQQEPSRESVVK
jgi:hypothetical protein